jgi:hypothetical protein
VRASSASVKTRPPPGGRPAHEQTRCSSATSCRLLSLPALRGSCQGARILITAMACRPWLPLHKPATATRPAVPIRTARSERSCRSSGAGAGRGRDGLASPAGREGGAPSRAAKAGGLAFISAVGGLGGLALAAHGDRRARTLGVATGAAVLAGSDAIARHRQRPGEILPLWHRILSSAALAGPLGWAAGRLTPAGPVGIAIGA